MPRKLVCNRIQFRLTVMPIAPDGIDEDRFRNHVVSDPSLERKLALPERPCRFRDRVGPSGDDPPVRSVQLLALRVFKKTLPQRAWLFRVLATVVPPRKLPRSFGVVFICSV